MHLWSCCAAACVAPGSRPRALCRCVSLTAAAAALRLLLLALHKRSPTLTFVAGILQALPSASWLFSFRLSAAPCALCSVRPFGCSFALREVAVAALLPTCCCCVPANMLHACSRKLTFLTGLSTSPSPRPIMHRCATCCASSGCGAKGDGCDALMALLMEAAATAASAQQHVVRAAAANLYIGPSPPLRRSRESSLGVLRRCWRC